MKIKYDILFAIVFVSLIYASIPVHALSFGGYAKNDKIDLESRETGYFEILLYSREDESVSFELSLLDFPQDFIITYPKHVDYNSYEEYEYISFGGEYIKSCVIRVLVQAPNNVDSGPYEILLKVVTKDKSENLVNINAEKVFRLVVNDVSDSTVSQTNFPVIMDSGVSENQQVEIQEEKIYESDENILNEEKIAASGLFSLINETYVFWGVVLIFIFFISFMVYRFSFNKRE